MRPHPLIRAVPGALLAAVLLVLGTTVPVTAAPPKCPDGTIPSKQTDGWICIPATSPEDPESPGKGDPGGTGTTPRVCHNGAGEVPCSNDFGVWDSAQQCYAAPFAPQPPAGDPMWEGHDASEGSVWGCDPTMIGPWLPWFVPASETPADPGTVAESVVETMPLVKPTVRMAPSPPAQTYVNMETWLWVNPDEWRTVTASATAGATVVTVKAEPVEVVWDLGGETFTCSSPGRPWTAGMTARARTNCSHVFTRTSTAQPDGVIFASTQIIYRAAWTCTGVCSSSAGSLGDVRGFASDRVAVRVGEIQSLVTDTGVRP